MPPKKIISSWGELPKKVQHAAQYGLKDPEDCGAPGSVEDVISAYNNGVTFANMARVAVVQETGVFCGDCGYEIPYGSSCPHIRIGKCGKREITD